MSTEQKPATEPKAEPNALAATISASWEQFKQGKLLSYPMMAVVLLLIAGIGITVYIVGEKRKAESAKWTDLDSRYSYSIKSLEEFAEKPENAGGIQAKLATLEIARATRAKRHRHDVRHCSKRFGRQQDHRNAQDRSAEH